MVGMWLEIVSEEFVLEDHCVKEEALHRKTTNMREMFRLCCPTQKNITWGPRKLWLGRRQALSLDSHSLDPPTGIIQHIVTKQAMLEHTVYHSLCDEPLSFL